MIGKLFLILALVGCVCGRRHGHGHGHGERRGSRPRSQYSEEESIRTIKITADDYVDVYIDGVQMLDDTVGNWRVVKSVDPTQCYTSVAVKGLDTGGVAMVVATFSDGTQTDASWRVTTKEEEGWTGAFFDDSAWAAAYEIGQKDTLTDPPWSSEIGSDISGSAYYIWTENYRYGQGGDHVVYLRKTFNDCNKYDCGNRDPCDPLLIPNRYFYANYDETKFIQCDAFGACHLMDCQAGEVWDDNLLTCV